MNEDQFNISIRKFLKELGVTSQREIEKAVREAVESGKLKGTATLPVKAVVTIGEVDLSHTVEGSIAIG